QSFVSSSPSCCGSTFGMGPKSRFAGDNVMLGTKIQKERNTLRGTITVNFLTYLASLNCDFNKKFHPHTKLQSFSDSSGGKDWRVRLPVS
uniref:hypothetical protein n=1 Tax=Prevotella sp. TaxID=59823 RepID=UPI0040264C17